MKILQFLNKFFFPIFILSTFFSNYILANEPVDIWNLEKQTDQESQSDKGIVQEEKITTNSIYKMQSNKKKIELIDQNQNIVLEKNDIAGLYDPADNDLTINMWRYADGQKIIKLVKKLEKVNLSEDAKEILDIAILTNAHNPDKNITTNEFLKLKSDWLIKKSNLNLIKEYLIKNNNIEINSELIRFYLDEYLSMGKISDACEIFKNPIGKIKIDYIEKFNIYCLLNDQKTEEALLQFDLLKEAGFKDEKFEKYFFHIVGYEEIKNIKISEKTLLDFHLSNRIKKDFIFEPQDNTSELIWRYLSSFNLLAKIDSVDLEDEEKILTIEKATNNKNYKEKDLFNLYKRFMFSINQLLAVEESYKVLPNFKARALLYQGILLAKNDDEKIRLIKTLKELFINDNIPKAFDDELISILKTIDINKISSSFTSFYNFYLVEKEVKITKIKFNNKILHQSKILNYFIDEEYNKKTIEKDINKLLKKLKKNKKYFFSTKDLILIDSLKSDNIIIPKKYEDLFESNSSTIPVDIQFLINNNQTGLVLLRLSEIIGQDMIKDMDPETLHFIISALNQLNIDKLRNKILLKVLPLKV
jgi:hypothetical protein